MERIFKDREVQYPNRIRLVPVPGQEGVYDVERAEGTVIEPGTVLDAALFNAMEEDIEEKAKQNGTYSEMTVGKAKADQKGNVIDATYAKLTQVVTKDNSTGSIDALTSAAKYFLRNKQVSTGEVSISATGWYRIAKLPTCSSSRITVTKHYKHGRGVSLILDVAVGDDNTEDATTNIVASYAGMKDQRNYIDKIRYKQAGRGQVYIDVHIISDGGENSYWLAYDGTSAYSTAFTSSQFALYDFQQTSDTGGTELPMPEDTGLATTGTIYQQGSPVFATDPSKLAPSTANGWTEITPTEALPSVGVYLIAIRIQFQPVGGIGGSFLIPTPPAIGVVAPVATSEIRGSAILSYHDIIYQITYDSSKSNKWSLNIVPSESGTNIELDKIYYKRIA